jgi:hypothetical protein
MFFKRIGASTNDRRKQNGRGGDPAAVSFDER